MYSIHVSENGFLLHFNHASLYPLSEIYEIYYMTFRDLALLISSCSSLLFLRVSLYIWC